MKPMFLSLLALLLVGCATSDVMLWSLTCRPCGLLRGVGYGPVQVEPIIPDPAHVAAIRANQAVRRRAYTLDFSLDFW